MKDGGERIIKNPDGRKGRAEVLQKHNTRIEWTHIPGFRGETWNPVTGCSKVSPGCANCYIERSIPFRMKSHKFEYDANTKSVSTPIMLHSDRLDRPRHWKAPRAIFVNSLSDLFHDDIPDSFILDVWRTMRDTPQHIYMILTKRPERMQAFVNRIAWHTPEDGRGGYVPYLYDDGDAPLKNVWLGVSVENQTMADKRIPLLLQTRAAVRFLSCEPLLRRVDLSNWLFCAGVDSQGYFAKDQGIDWVVVGGESGPGARPMNPAWAVALRDECLAADVPFFFKQWGEHVPAEMYSPYFDVAAADKTKLFTFPNGQHMVRVGKKAAGAVLGGREWREFPVIPKLK